MLDAKWGRIVNVGSGLFIEGLRLRLAYVASKNGLPSASRALAHETAKKGVTVNCVCPGVMSTRRSSRNRSTHHIEDRRSAPRHQSLIQFNPSRRIITPEKSPRRSPICAATRQQRHHYLAHRRCRFRSPAAKSDRRTAQPGAPLARLISTGRLMIEREVDSLMRAL